MARARFLSVHPGPFFWGVLLGGYIWVGLLAVGVSGGRSFIAGAIGCADIFLFVRTYGDDQRRRRPARRGASMRESTLASSAAEVRSGQAAAPPPQAGPVKDREVRLALVLNGGVSLAVWIGGVAREIDAARRATAVRPADTGELY